VDSRFSPVPFLVKQHKTIPEPLAISSSSRIDPNPFFFKLSFQLKVMYHRRVNPNRVHLTSELVVDESNNTQATIGAEYILKQSKVQMSIDNSLLLKSTLESQVLPGISMQFSAEMAQAKDHYRFGYSIAIQ